MKKRKEQGNAGSTKIFKKQNRRKNAYFACCEIGSAIVP